MSKYKFVEEIPEPKRGRSGQFDDFIFALLERRGEWAIYPGKASGASAYNTASAINNGRRSAFPADNFEAVARNGVLYVRAKPNPGKGKK